MKGIDTMIYTLTFYPVELSDINGAYSTRLKAIKALDAHRNRMGNMWSSFQCIYSGALSARYTFKCMGVECYADICAHEIDDL